ncbi:MAG: hypothetical protein ACOCVJ_02245 [Verrucomicrobiota bacterium]
MSEPAPLEPGRKAPPFSCPENGTELTNHHLGAPHPLCFHPADDTPVRTTSPLYPRTCHE